MPTTVSLDMMQTVALAALVLFAGYGIRRNFLQYLYCSGVGRFFLNGSN